MMVKHSGCFLCGLSEQEILVSTPIMYLKMSVALCGECRGLANETIRKRVDVIMAQQTEVQRAARAAANRIQ